MVNTMQGIKVPPPGHNNPRIRPPNLPLRFPVGQKEYKVELELEAPYAIWSRPDTGDCTVSSPFPAFSQVQGIFKSICATMSAEVIPVECRICSPIVYHSITTNYRGPYRNPINLRKRTSEQQRLSVLLNVCYQFTAAVRHFVPPPHRMTDRIRKHFGEKQHGPHAYVDIFNRRLKTGNYFHTPFLGQKEFVPTYIGPFREETKPDENLNFVIQSMPYSVFDQYRVGRFRPVSRTNVRVIRGVAHYA